MMEQARKKRATDIFKLKGNVYAFDPVTSAGIPFTQLHIPAEFCPHGLPDLQVPSPQGSQSENRNITKNPVRHNAYGTKI